MRKLIFVILFLIGVPLTTAQSQLKTAKPDFKFWVYDTIPKSNDSIMAIYDKIVPSIFPALKKTVNDDEYVELRHPFTYEQTAKYLGLNKKGVVRFEKNKIEYKEIDSLVFNAAVSDEGMFVDLVYKDTKPQKDYSWTDPFLIFDVDPSFLTKHKVYLNRIQQNNDNNLKNTLLQEVKNYSNKTDSSDYSFFMSDNGNIKKITDKDFFNLFYVVIYTIENVPVDDFCIATFYYKNDPEKYYTTTYFFSRKKAVYAGHFNPYFSFTIDKKWYFCTTHQVKFECGWWGKNLFVFENGEFKWLIADYSFAD